MIKDSKLANEEEISIDAAAEQEQKADEKKKASKKSSKSNKEVQELKDMLSAKIDEMAELNDRYLRLMAEYDNYKKRTAKEKEQLKLDTVGDTVTELLPIIDNFERAISAFSDEDKESEFYKGVEMIYKQCIDSFVRLGVTEIEAVGEEFNPELHNAIMHIDDETIADNTIVEQFQKGYVYKDKVIRYSMVKVAN